MRGVVEKIGWDLGCLVDVEVEEGLQVAKERKYQAVEIFGDESLSDLGLRGLWPWEEKIWNAIKPMLKPFQFKAYHAPYVGLNFLTLNPIIRETSLEQIKRAIDIAAEMGLNPVIIHPGTPREGMDERVVDLLMSTFLYEVAQYAEEKQTRVAVECSEHLANISILQHYVTKIDSPYLGMCLNINEEMVKLNKLDNELLCEFIHNNSEKVFHVRFHGMVMEQSNGLINYGTIVQALLKEGYSGALIFRDNMATSESINKTVSAIYKVG